MKIRKIAAAILLSAVSICASATNHHMNNLEIKFIRAVGDYSAGNTYDNIIELHFTQPISWPNGMNCTNTVRVMVDSAHSHIVSAAYTALTAGMKVNVNVDDTLPVRNGSCEVSYLDIVR